MKRLIIVGNSKPKRNLSAYIDGSDFVVRINNAESFSSGKTGVKTDAIALECSGQLRETVLKTNPLIFSGADELWPEEINGTFFEYVDMFSAEAKVFTQLQKAYRWPDGGSPDIGIVTLENVIKMSKFGRHDIFACLLPVGPNDEWGSLETTRFSRRDFNESLSRVQRHVKSGTVTYIN